MTGIFRIRAMRTFTAHTWRARRRWVFPVVAAGIMNLSLEGATVAAAGTHATCEFVARGTISPGLNSLAGLPPIDARERDQKYYARGPITCKGTIDGHQVPVQAGTITLWGADGSGLTGNQPHNSCVFADVDLQTRVEWPGSNGRAPVRLRGHILYVGVAFDGLLKGKLGSSALVGRAGLGADPDKHPGICTEEYPYDNWLLSGQFVTGEGTATRGVDHQTVIAGLQYLGGGTVISPDTNNPNVSASLFSYPVTQGDRITFTNLDTHPHTVTSCSRSDCDPRAPALTAPAPAPQLVGSGTAKFPRASGAFDGDLFQVGDAFTIDTSRMAPATYYYFCELHPFMRGSFKVTSRHRDLVHQAGLQLQP